MIVKCPYQVKQRQSCHSNEVIEAESRMNGLLKYAITDPGNGLSLIN